MRLLSTLCAALATMVLALVQVTAANAQTASTWDAIQERGTLRIGVTQSPPWYFKDAASGEWTGVGVSMGTAMAEVLGADLETLCRAVDANTEVAFGGAW